MKKVLAVILTVAIAMSFAVIPVHASGFSSANILNGGSRLRGNFKCPNGSSSSYWSRSQNGNDQSTDRVIQLTMQKAFKAQRCMMESGIADPLSGTEYESAHFAHARIMIAVKKVGSETCILRLNPVDSSWVKENKAANTAFELVYSNEYSTCGWMKPYKGKNGSTENDQCHIYTSTDPTVMTTKMYEGRNFLRFGTTDTPDYQTFDFIFDCKKGYIYGYIDGRLVTTYTASVCNFGNFYGYSITSSSDDSSFVSGTKVWFKYDPTRVGETVYVDTDDYTVRLEDVLVDAGLASRSSDPHQIMQSDHIGDYVFPGTTSSSDVDIYERRDSSGNPVSVTAEKVKTSGDNVAQLYGGAHVKGKDWPGYAKGKGTIYVGFDQKINTKLNSGTNAASTSYSYRVLSQDSKTYKLFDMAAGAGNKMQITLEKQLGSSNPTVLLDKDFNDTIHYDIILYGKHYSTAPETTYAEAVGHYFVDGVYIGSYKINRGSSADAVGTDLWWTPTQLFLYSNNTANVTYSNYKIAVYDEEKTPVDLVAEIDSSQVNWAYNRISIGTGAYSDTFTVTTRIAAAPEAVSASSRVHIGVYGENNMLLDYDSVPYTTETITSERFNMNYNGVMPSCVKVFLWNDMEPITGEAKVLFDIDPITYYAKVSYDNGMTWSGLDYRADYSDATEYSYPVANREVLAGAVRVYDNLYTDKEDRVGSVINVENSVFDTVTLEKGTNSLGYAFFAAKPEIYKNSKKLPNGYSPTYAAGYTRVVYTDESEVTLTIPDNAKYLYLYDHGTNADTSAYENALPSAITFSNSGVSHNANSIRIATWNIGHYSLGSLTNADATLGFTASDYRNHVRAIDADIFSVNEYSADLSATEAARSAIFGDYPFAFEGEQNQYTGNAIFARSGLITNPQVHYFECYQAAGGSGADKPSDHYYITSDLTINGKTVKFVNAHLYYEDEPQTLAIQAINELIDVFSGYDRVIILGDCNVTYGKFQLFKDAGYGLANNDGLLATYGPCQDEKYKVDIADGYGTYDNIIYKGVNISDFALGGTKLSDHYTLYCNVTVD